ncbi:rod shape-determining protein MreD [Phycicoccus sp.]|mgnify:CR=1 FL=1|uniref:rod shape-determining protein MreD n=1 Tax=Phycicoccus sp. TaxID=1902410 RepID=UPI002BD6BA7E|nr:rod shape-determining protein MreD [Phycicoccus sp.]HMM93810.1 rod shape-determining protein MreD [Phycicoccus sp.]
MGLLGLVLRGAGLVLAVLVAVGLAARHLTPVPNLVVVLVVAWALWRGPVAGAVAGLVGGWVLDLVPPGAEVLGVHALVYAAAGMLAGRLRVTGPVAAPRVAAVTLLASVVVEGVDVVRALAVQAPVGLADVAVRCLLTATLGALVVPVVVRAERAAVRRRFG